MATKLKGLFPVGITPFDDQGRIDEASLRRSIEFYVQAGVDGVAHVFNGSEFYALTDEERRLITRVVVQTVGGRVPVMIGVAGVSIQHTIELAKQAEQAGATCVGSMPSYIRQAMSNPQIEQYYRALGAAVSVPVVIQNALAPGGVPMPPDFVARLLREIDHVDYVKEETRNPGRAITAIRQLAGDACQGILGGAGGKYVLDEYRRGACGTMPYPHVPDVQAALWKALEADDWPKARQIFYRLLPLYTMEGRFGPVLCKEILRRRGIISTTTARVPAPAQLDAVDHEELSLILADLRDLFTCHPPCN
jgi:4-hydroxy-tetrahydrodipicolinate synthase